MKLTPKTVCLILVLTLLFALWPDEQNAAGKNCCIEKTGSVACQSQVALSQTSPSTAAAKSPAACAEKCCGKASDSCCGKQSCKAGCKKCGEAGGKSCCEKQCGSGCCGK